MADVVLDTDIASAFQKGRAPDWAIRHVIGARVWLTFVTVGELWKWAEIRSWGGPPQTGPLRLALGRHRPPHYARRICAPRAEAGLWLASALSVDMAPFSGRPCWTVRAQNVSSRAGLG